MAKKEGEINISVYEWMDDSLQGLTVDFERIQLSLYSLNVGVWSMDILTNSLVVCNRCKKILPIPDQERVSIYTLTEFIAVGYEKKVVDTFLITGENDCNFDLEFPLGNDDGPKQKWIRVTGISVFCDNKSGRKVYGTIEDISDRKRIELRGQDFLAMVSHELRSPLSAIKLYLQMTLRKLKNDRDNSNSFILEKAERQVDKMNKMIQCFLEPSVIESGELNLASEQFDMKELLNEVIEDLVRLNPLVKYILKCDADISISADRDKISQVLQNLMSNAVKYSPDSKQIIIRLGKSRNNMLLAIKDFGIGINSTDKERVFDRFYRVETETGITTHGYGIGLYISRQIILQHKGSIWLKSRPGKGSSFYFTLPLS